MESSSLLSRRTSVLGLKLWSVLGIAMGVLIVLLLLLLALWLASKKKPSRRIAGRSPSSILIPIISEEIKEVDHRSHRTNAPTLADLLSRSSCQITDPKSTSPDHTSISSPKHQQGGTAVSPSVEGRKIEPQGKSPMKEDDSCCSATSNVPSPILTPTILGVSHLDWGHCFTVQDLNAATNGFSSSNVLGEGGYGIVHQGQLPDGTLVAVKSLLNSREQAEKEFIGEVEAIGRVRHKHLVRLLGYCAEGPCRMLVYEYIGNGTLDKWLHGPLGEKRPIPWDIRMRIILGTAKGLAYLHEGLEPKVIHRDVKSSNILLDSEWNAKVSDFGLAKLLGSGKSHVTTRVMGTFGYVAPEYASTGLLNERSDIYSFGVLLMELISGRQPVDYGRPEGEVHLVDWLKAMVGSRRSEEVADPKLQMKPSPRELKRALLLALRCVDPDSDKRPRMGHVIHMLEADSFPYHDDHRRTAEKKSPHHHDATIKVQMLK